jgi:alanine-glyoxylate transaminase / serine-glyoxylate transaminase / serine-pyruvate transaminase
MEKNHLKLMIPGPIQPDPDVLAAMGEPVRAHYGPSFLKLYTETLERLRQVFNTQSDLFLMVGSGSVAIDACLGSSMSTGEKVLVGINGFFGERLKAIAESYGLKVVPVTAELGTPLRAEDFDAAFSQHPDASAAVVVHLETSTTVVNPIEEIGAVIRKYGKFFIVDAVSSMGGMPFKMDEWGVDLCPTASQKCLGAPPGLAPVAVSQRGWEAINRNPNKGHGWYGDLRVWKWYATNWNDWHPYPITMATNNIAALNVSLEQLLKEGIPQRMKRYRRLALCLRDGLRQIGMQPFTSDEMMAPVLTAAICPPGVSSGEIVAFMETERHIKISGGLGSLKEKIIRIGHMSPVLNEGDIDEVLNALAAFGKN